jgi:histidinol-phosphate/aromatic aminotransferase/cobyric acid decarboxylase-like protein
MRPAGETTPAATTAVPAPGAHGGDGERVAAALGLEPDEVLDLSASLNPFAPDVVLLAQRHLGALRRYPDVDAAERLVAAMVGVDAERLVLTAGGAQAIALVADHLGAGWVDEPDFSLYRRHLGRLDEDALTWRSDPHNPSGTLAVAAPSGPAVWDEAFLPLSAGTWTRGRPGWALCSLTKAFACPGLRMGYAVAPDDAEAAAIRQRRPMWAVSSLACAVLPELVDESDPPGWTAQIAVARKATVAVLQSHGLHPWPSHAPWLLVPHAGDLRAALAGQAVVVRDCRSFGLDDHVRIAVPSDADLDRLDVALGRVR